MVRGLLFEEQLFFKPISTLDKQMDISIRDDLQVVWLFSSGWLQAAANPNASKSSSILPPLQEAWFKSDQVCSKHSAKVCLEGTGSSRFSHLEGKCDSAFIFDVLIRGRIASYKPLNRNNSRCTLQSENRERNRR